MIQKQFCDFSYISVSHGEKTIWLVDPKQSLFSSVFQTILIDDDGDDDDDDADNVGLENSELWYPYKHRGSRWDIFWWNITVRLWA